MKNWGAIILLSLSPIFLFSSQNDTLKQVSLEFYPKWYSTNDITFQGNIGIQTLHQEYDWVTYYIKPSTTYALSYNVALHGGLGFYYTDNKGFANAKEWRPFIGISHFTNFTDNWGISSYFRTEERYRASIGADDSSQTTRLRLRFRNSYKLNPLSTSHAWHKLTLDLEGFKSFNNETSVAPTYDYETRVSLGAEYSLEHKKKMRFELAWKYKTQPTQISDSDISTIFFKIQYFPSWGSRLRNRLKDRDIDE